jgi:hypothetical protein
MMEIGLMPDTLKPANETGKQPGLLQVIGSVLAAVVGIQKGENRARDFTHGKPSHFIIVGLVVTVVLVLLVWGLVKLVLYVAGI